jgi:hypothetical protein
MSDYGLNVTNSSNAILIDSTYKNYVLNETNSTSIIDGITEINISDVSSVPIFASKADSSYYHSVYGCNKSGSNYVSAWIFRERPNPYAPDPPTSTLYWKVFIPGYKAALPTYGLIVRNSSNEIVFSSNDSYLKIKGVYSVSNNFWDTDDITVVNAANNYFFLSEFSYASNSECSGSSCVWYKYSRGFKYLNSTTIRVGTFLYEIDVAGGEFSDESWITDCLLVEIGY